MDPKELARDNAATKAYASFMVDLSDRVPTAVLPCASMILCHLDEDVSYIIVWFDRVNSIKEIQKIINFKF